MPKSLWMIAVCVGLVFTKSVTAIEPTVIDDHLKRPIIGPDWALQEVQSFTEDRIPAIPKFTNADEWQKFAEATREKVLTNVVFRGEAAKWKDLPTRFELLGTIEGGPGYKIKKLRFEAVPGLWVPALLYEPDNLTGKVPVVMNVNGHDTKSGKAAKYKQIRCINQAKRGMIALNVEWLGMGQLRSEGFSHYAMNQLDLCGTAGLAPFYLAMKRGIDVLLMHENADPNRVAVAGLSGGGWQTIFISSLDTRVKLCNPVAGYSSFHTRVHHFKDLGDSEQTPCDLATVADYTHLTAMLSPRPALLTFNEKDNCCFEAPYALPPLMDAAATLYKLQGAGEKLRSHINTDPGTHNFERDNREALYRMFGDFFYAGDKNFDAKEIASDDELKSFEELMVALPDNNHSFNSLAIELAKSLPSETKLPTDKKSAREWQSDRRKQLAKIAHYEKLDCEAQHQTTEQVQDVTITRWRLKIGKEWTVPAVEFTPKNAKQSVIVLNDEGRTASGKSIANLLEQGNRVLALDPFYFGESKISQKDFLFALLVAAVGERPLGIQASQVAAVARWLSAREKSKPIGLVAEGPRSSTFALVAAAIEPDAIDSVNLNGCWASFQELLKQNRTVQHMPEMFCFGLLKEFDIVDLQMLIAPRSLTYASKTPQSAGNKERLASWSKLLGSQGKSK